MSDCEFGAYPVLVRESLTMEAYALGSGDWGALEG